MLDPSSFNRVALRYDADNAYPPSIAARIARGMLGAGQLTPRSQVLELAAGTGRITLPLLAVGIDVTAVDFSPGMLDRLRLGASMLRAAPDAFGGRVGQLSVIEGDITHLPDEDASIDAVVAVHIFHLIPTWRRVLAEVLRVLTPEGTLLLGQDRSEGHDPYAEIKERWCEIVAELGIPASELEYPGAGFDTVISRLKQRGMEVDPRRIASWEEAYTPRAFLERIRSRAWSRTWAIPDTEFAESVRRLDAWALRHFGPSIDVPRRITMSFTLARVTRRRPGSRLSTAPYT